MLLESFICTNCRDWNWSVVNQLWIIDLDELQISAWKFQLLCSIPFITDNVQILKCKWSQELFFIIWNGVSVNIIELSPERCMWKSFTFWKFFIYIYFHFYKAFLLTLCNTNVNMLGDVFISVGLTIFSFSLHNQGLFSKIYEHL